MIKPRNIALLVSLLPQVSHAQGTFQVRFAENQYVIEPGASVKAALVIDPLPSEGLFGFAARLVYDGKFLRIDGVGAITLPAALDNDGVFGPGAFKAVESNAAAVRGSVDPLLARPGAYRGQELATFTITDVSGTVGSSSEVKIEFFRTLGPTETTFVSGDGLDLDRQIQFSTSIFQVVPEPSVGWVALGGVLTWLCIGGRKGASIVEPATSVGGIPTTTADSGSATGGGVA